MNNRAVIGALLATSFFPQTLLADSILSRPELAALLGPGATTVTFDSLGVANDSAETIAAPLMMDGLTIGYPAGGYLEVYGVGYYGQPSIDLSGDGTGGVTLTFSSPVTTIGFDLPGFAGFSSSTQVEVLGVDLTTYLYTSPPMIISGPATPTFFGYTNNAGIGMVKFLGGGQPTNISNITFGVIVPEPRSLLTMGIALALLGLLTSWERRRSRRRFLA